MRRCVSCGCEASWSVEPLDLLQLVFFTGRIGDISCPLRFAGLLLLWDTIVAVLLLPNDKNEACVEGHGVWGTDVCKERGDDR
jgi:hypothetical protein